MEPMLPLVKPPQSSYIVVPVAAFDPQEIKAYGLMTVSQKEIAGPSYDRLTSEDYQVLPDQPGCILSWQAFKQGEYWPVNFLVAYDFLTDEQPTHGIQFPFILALHGSLRTKIQFRLVNEEDFDPNEQVTFPAP